MSGPELADLGWAHSHTCNGQQVGCQAQDGLSHTSGGQLAISCGGRHDWPPGSLQPLRQKPELVAMMCSGSQDSEWRPRLRTITLLLVPLCIGSLF